ncbi:hypothetical protein HERIO_331 [Hepatospora eriocheir]|uniref:Uncharacterized protein n=1 Tax=Hepatospora eriocheir TaxID=1081669 RepID=A0A1X0QDG1_9MICR|nr:hypothetical protein HERIO_331 [Hepatospora eriocheir]
MNFSKFFFKVNICLGCTLVSDNSYIILEEDDEIEQMIEEYMELKNFLMNNVPLVIRLLESKYCDLSVDEFNSTVRQLNINFRKEQINNKEDSDKKECIRDFNNYILIKLKDKLERFGKLIIRKVKNNNQVELDCSRCSSFQSTRCIYEFLDSLKENKKDIRLSNDKSLLKIYMDFLSMNIFLDKIICEYNLYRCLIILIIEVKEKILSSDIFNGENVVSPSEFDEIYSSEVKESLSKNFFNDFSLSTTSLININDDEKIKKFFNEFSKYIVEMIVLIEKYDYCNNSLTHFAFDSCVFKYLDNYNDVLRKEIQQLNTKLSNLLFIESKNYKTKLNYYIRMLHFYDLKCYIPFSYLKNNYSVLEKCENIKNDQDTTEDDIIFISDDLLNKYEIIILILVNPSLKRYLFNKFLF